MRLTIEKVNNGYILDDGTNRWVEDSLVSVVQYMALITFPINFTRHFSEGLGYGMTGISCGFFDPEPTPKQQKDARFMKFVHERGLTIRKDEFERK